MDTDRHRDGLLDLALAGAVCAIELADMFAFDAGGRHDPIDVALLVASGAVLLIRRRWPFSCLTVAGGVTIALAARHAPHIGLGAIAATYALAAFASPGTRRAAAGPLLVAVWLVPLLTADTDSIPRNLALFGAAWTLGRLMRDRREQHEQLLAQTVALAREREEKLALAARAERSRLTQEVHDVLTHGVSVIVVQAQGAQAVGDDPARVRLALERIERTGREALTDLRTLLQDRGAGEGGELPLSPQPTIARIDELARAAREAGIDVALTVEPSPRPLPASLELSVYRIVQEALTNVLRHSGAEAARVDVRCRDGALEIEIVDDGRTGRRGAVPRHVTSGGRGIAGMRARAASCDGTLEAHGLRGGGFRVVARLPVPA